MRVKIILVSAFVLLFSSCYACAQERDKYVYIDVAAGHFPERRADNDGEIPAWVSLGVAREYRWGEVYVELYHRSNLDKGWPFATAGEDEYQSYGARVGARRRWRF